MLLRLHSAFLLSVAKMLLKGKFGSCALNSHGNYIVDHEKSWNCVYEFLWEHPKHLMFSISVLGPRRPSYVSEWMLNLMVNICLVSVVFHLLHKVMLSSLSLTCFHSTMVTLNSSYLSY